MRETTKKVVAIALVFQLLGIGIPQVAHAVILGTQQILAEDERGRRIERIDRVLAQDEVQERFVALGVDPDEARLRVASLSDSELRQLESGLDAIPAGGQNVIWIVGAVFIVLLVLEVLGVTNVFTSI